MAKLDSLVVEIKADLTDIRKNMKNAVKATRQSSKKMTDSNKLLATGFNKVRIAAIAAAAGIIYMGKQTLNEVDRIQKLGIRLDETTENLSRMKFVAEQSGIEFNTLAMAFQRMQRRVAEAAKGTGEAKDALKELGLSAKDLNQLSVSEQFMKVTEAMNEVKNGSEKTRLSMKLFDSEGVALIQIMNQGTQAINKLAKATPNVITQKDADRIATFNDNMNVLKKNIQGSIIPMLSKMAKKVNKIFEVSDKIKKNELENKIESTKEKIRALDNQLKKLNATNNESSESVHMFIKSVKDSFVALGGGKPQQEEYITDIERTKTALSNARKELEGLQNLNVGDGSVFKAANSDAAVVDIKKVEKQAKESSTTIKDAMIGATDQWSSRLTDAIVDGGNMFESLADIAKRTAVEMMITNPFISALQGGINNLMTPSPTSGLSKGTNGMTINTYNTFNPNVAASVRAEIATAAPHIQAASIAGVQAALSNGKMRV